MAWIYTLSAGSDVSHWFEREDGGKLNARIGGIVRVEETDAERQVTQLDPSAAWTVSLTSDLPPAKVSATKPLRINHSAAGAKP